MFCFSSASYISLSDFVSIFIVIEYFVLLCLRLSYNFWFSKQLLLDSSAFCILGLLFYSTHSYVETVFLLKGLFDLSFYA